jgi:hypothetical protein
MPWARIKGWWPALFPALLLLPGLFSFPYPSEEAQFSDLTLAHYPYALAVRQTLWEYGSAPWWSALMLSGAPLAANPLAGVWYPPGWLAWFLPLPLAFNLLALLHILWGQVGIYKLGRAEGMSAQAALFCALGFGMFPKLFAHFGAGHLTLVYAVSWTPWLLWGVYSRQGKPESGRLLKAVQACGSWEAVVLGLIFLADPRWAVYAGVLWLGYSAWKRRTGEAHSMLPWLRLMVHWAKQVGQALLLALPLALPMMVFVSRSTRASMTAADFLEFSLPPARLLGLIYPDLGGFHEFMLYPGGVVLGLLVLALAWGAGWRMGRFWLMCCAAALIFALGEAVPGMGLLGELPLMGLLRVPARALFVFGFGLIMSGGWTLERLQSGITSKERKRAGLALAALASFALVLAAAVLWVSGTFSLQFVWGALAVTLGATWLFMGVRQRLPARAWWVGLVVLSLLDWFGVSRTLFAFRPSNQVNTEAQALVKTLVGKDGLFRVYSPSYSLPLHKAAQDGLQLADGVDPLQLQEYAEFMKQASGVPSGGYSVTLPPFENGDPANDNRGYSPDARLLGLLNVRYVAAEFDLEASGLRFVERFGNTRLYENELVLPRAWVQAPGTDIGEDAKPARVDSWRPGRVVLSAVGPGRLVISEIAYPGWYAWIDGKPVPLESAAGILQAVRLRDGVQQVTLAFRPWDIYLGMFGPLIFLALGLIEARMGKRSRPGRMNNQSKS